MMLGTKPGESYTDDEDRMYYDTRDGRTTYRTGKGGHGLYRWAQRAGSASWEQVRGETQWAPMPLAVFRARAAEAFDGPAWQDTVECGYCAAGIPVADEPTVPALDDEEEWERLAAQHADGCEWIETRAHRRDAES